MAISWVSCPASPLLWINFRELLLLAFGEPVLVLPSLFFACYLSLARLFLPRSRALILSLVFSLFASLLYSPLATSGLDYWLLSHLPHVTPASSAFDSSPPVVVLVGRGPDIAEVSTAAAVAAYKRHEIRAIYVSGDQRVTAERIVALGAPSSLVSGDSCARTTLENARFTANWLRQYHPGSPIILITDPWQLPRATLVFRRQGLRVHPQSAYPFLSPRTHNRIAWRETMALFLYRLQGRT